ncbi:hypothetical protein SUGI_0305130 [Cryptomeria japonica]|nr:hypothetical protein SUGI_0305130 [Cryptomeria japonica]
MSNSDIARIVNSDEVQSVVRLIKTEVKYKPLKKTSLKNLGALSKLNPYAKISRRNALFAEVERIKATKEQLLDVATLAFGDEAGAMEKTMLAMRHKMLQVLQLGPVLELLRERKSSEPKGMQRVFSTTILERKKAANWLVVDEAINDDNSVVCLHSKTMKKLQLFDGDTILIKRKKRKDTICVALADKTFVEPTIHQIPLERHFVKPEVAYLKLRFIRSCSASLAPMILEHLEFTHESGGDLQQSLRWYVVLPLYVRAGVLWLSFSSLSSSASRNNNKENVNVISVDLQVNDSLQMDVRHFSKSDMRHCKENEKVQVLLDGTSPSLEIETAGEKQYSHYQQPCLRICNRGILANSNDDSANVDNEYMNALPTACIDSVKLVYIGNHFGVNIFNNDKFLQFALHGYTKKEVKLLFETGNEVTPLPKIKIPLAEVKAVLKLVSANNCYSVTVIEKNQDVEGLLQSSYNVYEVFVVNQECLTQQKEKIKEDDRFFDVLSRGSIDDLKDSFQDEGFILERVNDFFNVLDILAARVNHNVIQSNVLWKRLIRSVCEQKIAKLKSSMLVLM